MQRDQPDNTVGGRVLRAHVIDSRAGVDAWAARGPNGGQVQSPCCWVPGEGNMVPTVRGSYDCTTATDRLVSRSERRARQGRGRAAAEG